MALFPELARFQSTRQLGYARAVAHQAVVRRPAFWIGTPSFAFRRLGQIGRQLLRTRRRGVISYLFRETCMIVLAVLPEYFTAEISTPMLCTNASRKRSNIASLLLPPRPKENTRLGSLSNLTLTWCALLGSMLSRVSFPVAPRMSTPSVGWSCAEPAACDCGAECAGPRVAQGREYSRGKDRHAVGAGETTFF